MRFDNTVHIMRDEFDRKAHDILCIIRYGSIGGGVEVSEMRKVSDVLRGHPYQPTAPIMPPIPIIGRKP